MRAWSYPAIQPVHPGPEALYNLANAPHFIEFRLQLVDFAQQGAETRDLRIGHCHGVARAVVLYLGRRLRLLRELAARKELAFLHVYG